MIAIVFIVIMAIVIGGASLFGGADSAAALSATSVPWWALLAVLGAFAGFFAGGIYVGALGRFFALRSAVLELSRRNDLGALDQLCIGVGAAVFIDGRDHVAGRFV